VPVAELSRQVGITEETLYRWKKQYKGLETDQVRHFKQLQEENARLKRLAVELTLDKTMLQDVLAKKNGVVQIAHYRAAPRGRHISGERAACVPWGADSGLGLPQREPAGAQDCTAAADSRDRPKAGSLRPPENPGYLLSMRFERFGRSGNCGLLAGAQFFGRNLFPFVN